MLTISDQAVQALEADLDQRFTEWIVEILQMEFPEDTEALGLEETLALVCRTRALATEWGVFDEEAVGQLCAMAIGFGEDMLRESDIKRYLLIDTNIAPRVRALMDEIDAIS